MGPRRLFLGPNPASIEERVERFMGTSKMNHPSARIGYARVSTADQNLDAQMAALEAAGCTMIRTETGGGASLGVDRRALTSVPPMTGTGHRVRPTGKYPEALLQSEYFRLINTTPI